jgi:hypothetical protein
MCVDTGILQGVWIVGYCKVCAYLDTARCVDSGILQGVWIVEYCKACGYCDTARCVRT